MKVLVDSREKKWDNIKNYFDSHGIEYEVKALKIGDYQLEGNPKFTIDRKQNLSELSRNLTNKPDRERFWREVKRAREAGVTMIIVCEHGKKIHKISDVEQWNDKYSGMTGKALTEYLYNLVINHGIDIVFCDKRVTGKKILEILEKSVDNS